MENQVATVALSTTKTAGGVIIKAAKKKLDEYKSKQEWTRLFIDTGEFFIKQTDRAIEMIDDVAIMLSKENMIELAKAVDDKNGFQLKSALRVELERLMCRYEIPYDEATSYISHFMQVIIAEIETNNSEMFEHIFLDDWREEEKQTLQLVTQRLKEVNQAIREINQRKLEIYSTDQIELNLAMQTENPRITLDFFEIDDEAFRTEFEGKLNNDCIYVSGKCREELIYCILYELRRLKVNKAVLVVKSHEDWEKLRLADQEKPELQGKILIPWFWSEEIASISGNTNIFVYGEDDFCAGKQPIKMRKRTRKTVEKKLEQAGVDIERAYRLVEDTHGLYIPLKKKIFKGSYNKKPNWVDGDAVLTLSALLCGKWTEDDGDKIILEQVSGKKYDEFIDGLYPYTKGEEPLIVRYKYHGKICYQLASLENAWDYLDCKLDIHGKLWGNFTQILTDILVESDPEFDFPVEERHIRAIMPEGKPLWSKMIRDGMLRSLIMRAYYKKDLESQVSIDRLIKNIFAQIKDVKQWLSIMPYFSELCEASPDVIKQCLENEWNNSTGLLDVFKETSGDIIFGSHLYTNILWGIEQFLVQDQHVMWAVRWLLQLSEENIKYPISNSPEEVLKDVFCPWINLTALSVEDRITLAGEMVRKYRKGWELLYAELPGKKSVVTGSLHHPRYREISEYNDLTNQDIFHTYEEYVLICLSNMEFSYERWQKMIREADNLMPNMKRKIFEQMEYEIQSMNDEEKIAIKDTLREEIYRHRYFKNAVWAMQENDLFCFEKQLQKIHTDDPVYEFRYLFIHEHGFPLLHPTPYDKEDSSFREITKKNEVAAEDEIRRGLQDFKGKGYDVIKLIEMCALKDNSTLGLYLCKYYNAGNFESKLYEKMLEIQPNGKMAISYAAYANNQNSETLKVAIEIAMQQAEEDVLVQLYGQEIISANKHMLISEADDNIKRVYWSNIHAHENNKETACWMLAECEKYGTQATYIEILGRMYRYFSPTEIMQNMENMREMEVGNLTMVSGCYLEELLIVLQKEYLLAKECEEVAQMELFYRSLLEWDKMKCFRRILEIEPAYYAEMVKEIYLKDGEEKKESTENQKSINSIYDLFSETKFCPAERDGVVNEQELELWVEKFKTLLVEQKQRRLFGHLLGRILANSPIGFDECYPCEAVRKIIEESGEDFESLRSSYISAIYNKRGVYSPSAGKEEMEIANGYKKNADNLRKKYPRTAEIYDSLFQEYKYQADSERERAEYVEY